MTPLRLTAALVLVLVPAACGGTSGDVPPAADPVTSAAAAEVTYEYHDEYGHGHCSVTALGDGEEIVVCIAATDTGSRVACFTLEEAQSTRNAKGLLRLDRRGEVEDQEEWPEECATAFAIVAPDAAGSAAAGY